jgi:TonB-dependent receptor
MRDVATGQLRLNRLTYAVSLAVASLVAANAAVAQDSQTAGKGAAANEDQVVQVTVVGTRASQQSSIDRKKNAATAMDSIVAADVGSLPDRNIGEAISRMSGVALDRGDYGEGVSVAVRGNSADLTRVEIDGQGVQSAGGTDDNGGVSRGVEFRQLSSDLIKSVDIVKGSTADMTEGSLGGGIIIKTRTGLDFKKPFVSVRVGGSQGSLNKKWEPDTNLILANKYLDGRLGVLLNASSSTLDNEAHSAQVATSAQQGYARSLDFDNSPEKTFTFQPNTLNMADAAATAPTAKYPYTNGSGYWYGATPQDILTKSAAAQTKQDCYAAFPVLTSSSTSLSGLSSSNRTNAINQRQNELLTCLNQWNDYTPSLLRYIVKREIDKRQDLDLRTDFKVNNELTVYAKGSYQKRRTDSNQLTYGLGGLNLNTAGMYTDATQPDKSAVRSAVPNSGYFLYPNNPSYVSGVPTAGTVANVDPSSVVVDAKHHVTQFGISDGSAGTDQLHSTTDITSKYMQAGGTFKRGRLTAEFLIGDAKSDYQRGDKRTSFAYPYGAATLKVLPNGLWTYVFPAGSSFDQSNPALYAQLKPATVTTKAVAASEFTPAIPSYKPGDQPLLTQAPQVTWTPAIRDTEERTAKLDLTWATPEWVPFFKRFKGGFNLRDTMSDAWGNGGYTVKTSQGTYGTTTGANAFVPGIYVPRAIVRGSFVGCQDTPGSIASGDTCKYGYNQSPDPRYSHDGQYVLTPQQFQDAIAAGLSSGNATATQFFNGAKNRPSQLIDNWTQIDVDKVFSALGVQNFNFDCVKKCMANDGKVYDQPVAKSRERTQAGYLMTDFGLDHIPFTDRDLPFGWELEGNMGYRYVRTQVHATGQMGFTSIVKTASFDPANPNAAGGTVTSTYVKQTQFDATTTDFLPIYNLAMWLVPDQVVLRYNHAKTVARPPVSYLIPSGTCIYDQTKIVDTGDTLDQSCTGTVGNPALQAQRNVNQNLSLEYYPNKDTMFSAAVFKQEGKVGPAIKQGVYGVPVFAGSSDVDPQTGAPLSDLRFDYTTYVNGAATTRKGFEFGTKTAFTFLPWLLRYTGFDANYTKVRSASSSQSVVDLLTGTPLPPARESKYSYNWALWYDDGKFAARLAVQAVASYFNCIAACTGNTVNNYPYVGGNARPLPWNPGSPNFKDSTRFIDGKISYKWRPNIEFFVEGRNLGNATTSDSQGQFAPFADGTPNLLDYAYSGRRIMVGVNFRNM